MKIEVGKRYVRRDGSVSGVISRNDDPDYPFTDELDDYTEGGYFWVSATAHPADLVSEYVEPVKEIPGLKGYRVVRYGKVKTGELYVGRGGITTWAMPESLSENYFVVEKIVPTKRTIVFKETLTRHGERWILDWRNGGDCPENLAQPDEILYTGNERTVEVPDGQSTP